MYRVMYRKVGKSNEDKKEKKGDNKVDNVFKQT